MSTTELDLAPDAVAEQNSKNLFEIGQRVEMTEKALEQGLQGRKNIRTGTVTGFGNQLGLVRVRRDDYQDSQSFHVSFWQPIPPAPATELDLAPNAVAGCEHSPDLGHLERLDGNPEDGTVYHVRCLRCDETGALVILGTDVDWYEKK